MIILLFLQLIFFFLLFDQVSSKNSVFRHLIKSKYLVVHRLLQVFLLAPSPKSLCKFYAFRSVAYLIILCELVGDNRDWILKRNLNNQSGGWKGLRYLGFISCWCISFWFHSWLFWCDWISGCWRIRSWSRNTFSKRNLNRQNEQKRIFRDLPVFLVCQVKCHVCLDEH
jgi:hypothetical protein